MRWDELFADLEAQAEAADLRERAGEIEERARIEAGRVGLVDRLRPSIGSQVSLRCAGDLALTGVLRRVGPDWLSLEEGAGREAVVRLAAVLTLSGADRWSDAPDSAGVVESRLGLRSVLRAITRDRSPVRLHLLEAGVVLDGTLDRVGSDFVELAGHAPGELRRRRDVTSVHLVPLPGISALRRHTDS